MKKLCEYYKFNRVVKEELGIEIEVELKNPVNVPIFPEWQVQADGSLRHFGIEFTTLTAINDDGKKRGTIKQVTDFIQASNPIKDSPRTSVHVHVNMQHCSPIQIWTAITAYWLVENLLFKQCGPDRAGNLFCLRLCDASALLSYVDDDIESNYPFSTLYENDEVRYAALNINALRKFGTLEYRGKCGTYDLDEIDEWTTVCRNLAYNPGNLFLNPEHLLDEYYNIPKKQDFLRKIFGDEYTSKLLKHKEWGDLLEQGVMNVLSLGYDYDWAKWNVRMVKARQKLKQPRPFNQRINPEVGGINDDDWAQDAVRQIRNAQVRPRAPVLPHNPPMPQPHVDFVEVQDRGPINADGWQD